MRSTLLRLGGLALKLKSITLVNFKGFEDLTIDFGGKSTIFFGINGVGKSTVLRAIDILYSRLINHIVKNRFKQSVNIELTDIKFGKPRCQSSGMFLFEDGNVIEYNRSMERKAKARKHYKKGLDEIYEKFASEYLRDESCDMPIFVNYGVNRLVADIPLRTRKHDFDKEMAFEKAIESKIDFRSFFEWMRCQEDYENEIKVREDPKYTDAALASVKKAVEAMLENMTNLRIERNPLAMKIDKNGISLRVEQLSEGEKCTLALFGDLARRLSLANPGSANPLYGNGVVLIDEIELHMHPSWQRKVVQRLKETFPNIQFIITTHSPQVLGEVGEDFNIFSFEREGDRVFVNQLSSLVGWDSNYILSEFMNTNVVNQATEAMIHDMYRHIEQEEYAEAEQLLRTLSALTNAAHEDVVKAQILIARGRRGNA